VSRRFARTSIPPRGVSSSLRHIHTTSPSLLPIRLNSQIKVVHSEEPKRGRQRTGPNNKRTWRDRIGSTTDRAISRLAEENREWGLRLNKYNRQNWIKYVNEILHNKGLAKDFGKPTDWLPSYSKQKYILAQRKLQGKREEAQISIRSPEEEFEEATREERNSWESREKRQEFIDRLRKTDEEYRSAISGRSGKARAAERISEQIPLFKVKEGHESLPN